jgi:hypothetical protein
MQFIFAEFWFSVLFTIPCEKEARVVSTQEITLGPNLTAEEAQAIYEQGPEAVVFALLQMHQAYQRTVSRSRGRSSVVGKSLPQNA